MHLRLWHHTSRPACSTCSRLQPAACMSHGCLVAESVACIHIALQQGSLKEQHRICCRNSDRNNSNYSLWLETGGDGSQRAGMMWHSARLLAEVFFLFQIRTKFAGEC